MRTLYRKSRYKGCRLCKGRKAGWEKRFKPKDVEELKRFEQEKREVA